jgi:hypothetical protein
MAGAKISWTVEINGSPHKVIKKSDFAAFWIKAVPLTTTATYGAHMVLTVSGAELHFDSLVNSRKVGMVTIENSSVTWEHAGPEVRTLSIAEYSQAVLLPMNQAITSLEYRVTNGNVTCLANAMGPVLLIAYDRPSSGRTAGTVLSDLVQGRNLEGACQVSDLGGR